MNLKTSSPWTTRLGTLAPERASHRPGRERAILWLEALLAIGAFAGAIGLISGGVDLGEATSRLPFGSPLFGGIALAVVNGVLPSVAFAAALRSRQWARRGHLLVGLALVGWIVLQVVTLGPPIAWLQVLYFIWGLAIVGLALQAPAPSRA
jgi:hypothetical protein